MRLLIAIAIIAATFTIAYAGGVCTTTCVPPPPGCDYCTSTCTTFCW